MPKVSVCIPAYNAALTLKETVDSVLSQTFQDFEILLQDNSSTDETWAMMLAMAAKDERIKPVRNSTNLGMLGNWNCVFQRAHAEFVLLLSADDCLLPDFLRVGVQELVKDPLLVNISTDHWLFWSGGQRQRKLELATGTYLNHPSLILLKNPFSINFTLFRRTNLLEAFGDTKVFRHYMTCDYDLHIRIALSGKPVSYINQKLGRYRLHDGNLSKQRRRMTRQALLTVLCHKQALSRQIPWTYRFTLLRFLVRSVVFPLRGTAWDARLVGLALGRLTGGTR